MAAIIRWIVLGAYLFWIGHYWRREDGISAHLRRTFSGSLSPRDRSLSIQILLLFGLFGGVALLGAAGWLPLIGLPDWLVLIGAGLMLSGLIGTYASRAALGRAWTPAARAQAHIVMTGPYGLVRHPIYTCVMVMYGGLALVFPGVVSLLAWVWISAAYALKAMEEERLLAVDPDYAAYRARVRWRLLPGVW